MVNPYRFYTYAYLREDRTPYYVGKGTGRRRFISKGKPCATPKDKTRIIFLKQNLTEEEAFKHEIYMISVFGRKDLGTGILYNKTDGGDGAAGRTPWNKGIKNCFGDETLKKMSESQKGEKNHNYRKSFSIDTRTKMSENQKGEKNNFYGRTHSKETREKIREKSTGRIVTSETREKLSKIHIGKVVSKDTIEKFRNNFKKNYILISPTGEKIEEYETIQQICKKYNLDQSEFIKVLNKKQKQHKGWTFFKGDDKILK